MELTKENGNMGGEQGGVAQAAALRALGVLRELHDSKICPTCLYSIDFEAAFQCELCQGIYHLRCMISSDSTMPLSNPPPHALSCTSSADANKPITPRMQTQICWTPPRMLGMGRKTSTPCHGRTLTVQGLRLRSTRLWTDDNKMTS